MAANTWITPTRVQMKKVYNVFFSDQVICTTLTNDPAVVTDWINSFYLSRAYVQWFHPGDVIVGVDARTRSDQRPYGTVALYFGQKCLVYQIHLSNVSIPEALQGFISDEDIVVAGSNILYKLKKLSREYGLRLDGNRYAETALDRHHTRDFIFEPGQVISDAWDAADLSDIQVLFATLVPYVCYQMAVAELRSFINQLNEQGLMRGEQTVEKR